MSGPTHCCICMVGSGGYAAGLWSSPTTYLDLCARIWIRAWSFGCGMGDHGRIPCCSMFRPILGLLKLTILRVLGGAHRSRMARLNITSFRCWGQACLHLYIALPCLPLVRESVVGVWEKMYVFLRLEISPCTGNGLVHNHTLTN